MSRAMALLFAQEGAAVVAVARRAEGIDAVAESIRSRGIARRPHHRFQR